MTSFDPTPGHDHDLRASLRAFGATDAHADGAGSLAGATDTLTRRVRTRRRAKSVGTGALALGVVGALAVAATQGGAPWNQSAPLVATTPTQSATPAGYQPDWLAGTDLRCGLTEEQVDDALPRFAGFDVPNEDDAGHPGTTINDRDRMTVRKVNDSKQTVVIDIGAGTAVWTDWDGHVRALVKLPAPADAHRSVAPGATTEVSVAMPTRPATDVCTTPGTAAPLEQGLYDVSFVYPVTDPTTGRSEGWLSMVRSNVDVRTDGTVDAVDGSDDATKGVDDGPAAAGVVAGWKPAWLDDAPGTCGDRYQATLDRATKHEGAGGAALTSTWLGGKEDDLAQYVTLSPDQRRITVGKELVPVWFTQVHGRVGPVVAFGAEPKLVPAKEGSEEGTMTLPFQKLTSAASCGAADRLPAGTYTVVWGLVTVDDGKTVLQLTADDGGWSPQTVDVDEAGAVTLRQ